MISFLRKHPKILCLTISILTSVNSFVLRWLTWSMLLLINLKGLDPNPPPPTAPTEPTMTVGMPYVPKWVAVSFKRNGHSEHPINKQRTELYEKEQAAKRAKEEAAAALASDVPVAADSDVLTQASTQECCNPSCPCVSETAFQEVSEEKPSKKKKK